MSMRRLCAAAACLIAGVSALLCDSPAAYHIEKSAPIMGTTFIVEVYARDRERGQRAASDALEEVRRIDRMLSNYRGDSELSKVNARAAVGPVQVSEELFDLLVRCRTYSERSGGTFDVTVGPLMKVWGFYKESGHMPAASQVQAALRTVGYNKVVLDQATHEVRFQVRGVSLDPGGIGKGYAVDRAVIALKRDGIDFGFISGGGSSIFGLGTPPNNASGWPVHIQNPWNTENIAETIYLRDRSLSTSGAFEKFFWADGHVYSHIMDPRTGYPAVGVVSVSVAAPSTLDSEIWAKPYYIQGRRWTLKHKPRDFAVYLCEDNAKRTCSWVER